MKYEDDTMEISRINPEDDPIIKGKNEISNLSIVALICMVVAVILISFDMRLIAGIIVLATASVVLLITRKTGRLISVAGTSINDASDAEEKKFRMISGFSHKIREPLNNIVLISDMLLNSDLQKKQKELVETLVASADNMVASVNELTMKSADRISNSPRRNIRFNILSTIQNTIDLFYLKSKTSLDIVFTKRSYDEYESYGDPIILKQIFLNIFNSIEESVSDLPARVNISLRKEKESGDVRIIGLRIQTDRSKRIIDNETGAGNLAMKLISMEKGQFSQESGENSTILNIILPFRYNIPVSDLPSPDKHENKPDAKKPARDLADCSILLVEDNLLNQRITLLALQPLAKEIDTASNGSEAIEKLMTKKYDIILLDIMMPVMDGIMTAQKIREMEQEKEDHIPVIAITADAMIDDREKCLSAGIDEYISKPFHPSQLINIINSVLNKQAF